VLVGCLSSDGEGTTLETWAGSALEAAAHVDGVTYGSYLLVPYGMGIRLVAAGIGGALRTGLLALPPVLTIPPGHPLADAVVPVLRAAGALVVWGVR
jgi:hypothetical protein